ncbi:hypothetical protein Glove_109g382 [Diversispora epigaea]|uniref:Uncharacterized protein n=1 Tax=Diversispora epigaea TaxID=1348612 RepID=A0A397J2J9_9GLOM|nr:hypothetical protein Glove_109g382 [Diversispora epigaea]
MSVRKFVISRSLLQQMKFVARYGKVEQYVIVIYWKSKRISMRVLMDGDDNNYDCYCYAP